MTRWMRFFLGGLVVGTTLAGAAVPAARAQVTSDPNGSALAPDEARHAPLVRAVLALRQQGRRDATRIDPAQVPGQAFPWRVLDADEQKAALLWSLFFRKSQVVFGAYESTAPVVGFYNPLVDFWLLTQWSVAPSGVTLTTVRIISGDRLGGGSGGEAPRWARPGGSADPVFAMQGVASAALSEFLRHYPAKANRPPALPAGDDAGLLARRLGGALGSLSNLRQNAAARQAVAATIQAVSAGDPLALAKQGEATSGIDYPAVVSMAPAMRTGLEPSLIATAEAGFLAWIGVPENGRWLLVAAYSRGDDGRYTLTRLLYIDLLQGKG